MNLTEGKSYYIDYKAKGDDTDENSYCGKGIYTGEFITDENNGQILYYFKNLRVKEGFMDGGWFSTGDIENELIHE